MIRISSFSPAENFTRRTWEFFADKLVVKTRSLTFDYENEVPYEKIKAIRHRRVADLAWNWASFLTVGMTGIAWLLLNYFFLINPTIEFIVKAMMVIGLLLIIPAFRRFELYGFLDSEGNFLATVRVDSKNRKSLLEAIQLIQRKTEIHSEAYLSDPLPHTTPRFQFTEFDFPDFLKKSTLRFYEDRLIYVGKSLVEELRAELRYEELSGKTAFARMGNNNWSNVWSYWLMFLCITTMPAFVFFTEWLRGNLLYAKLALGGLLLLIPMFFLKYIKSDVLAFYDKKDNVAFWTRVSAPNREKVKEIIAFVQEKAAPRN